MELVNKSVENYIHRHSGEEEEILHKIWRQTNLRTFYPNMVSGKVQGKLLQMIVKMVQPQTILEIGTFTGYSAVAMALAMPENSKLITIDNNEEIESMAKGFFSEAGLADKISMITGDAVDIIPKLNNTFDLVFIDADKEQYISYYRAVFPKIKKGGFIIADNVLWGGKVLDKLVKTDKETKGIQDFNEMINNDNRVEKVMLSVRDGLYLIRKN
jgi:predicted O-methyltransferase YrrM